ncbi:unnamed protein product [Vicia faba]|uniref:FAD-binding PCMH-type domain-containing protein n=1 Tax=Vicia faba TaxID=3906 RepID=A0AAV1B9U4_VICFA|nr:unnamed protein product [Vicia faba]
MTTMRKSSFLLTALTILMSISTAISSHSPLQNFLTCFSHNSHASKVIYTPNNTSFLTILNKKMYNKKFQTPTTPKPLAIIAAKDASHVQATIKCAKSNNIQIRIRSGGHDYEGYSYVSDVSFVIIDMFNINSVDINLQEETAWVDSGATLGAGGHFSGGGYGNMMRKYGLSVDNIIDAIIVDANSNILDRKSMGEDLFWAIRGGGGASFGVILSWKLKLVQVPSQLTVFNVKRSKKVVQLNFIGQFLGTTERLLSLIKESFPELNLKNSDCFSMPWINTTLFWYDKPFGTPLEEVLVEGPPSIYFKSKSDYVKNPIPKVVIESLWKKMIEGETMYMDWNPYGGRMKEILPSQTPFPHRAGNLFKIQYFNRWIDGSPESIGRHVNFSRLIQKFMTPYVSSSPREAFLNYRDADIGANIPSNITKFDIARTYGRSYFKANFERLVSVKTKVDPDDFFRYEQSIPTKTY